MNRTAAPADNGRILCESDAAVGARYKLNDIFCAAWLSHALTALAKHGVPDAVGDTATSIDEVAAKTGLHAPSLLRAMRAAASNGVFIQVTGESFRHNEVSKLLLTNNPYSWKGMACMWNHPSCLSGWSKFSDVLVDGRSGIEHAFGKTLYEHLAEQPGATMAFSDAMISNSAHASVAIAKNFPFADYKTVTDLAGGVGTLLAAILHEHKHLTGVIFEIEELITAAEEYLQVNGLSSRAEVVRGDFLTDIPVESDLYLVKNSLWNWGDTECSAIIHNVRAAIGSHPERRFLIIEYVIEPANAPWATLYDLQILNMPGGRARTMPEYENLLKDNGFEIEEVRYVEDQTLIVARPC